MTEKVYKDAKGVLYKVDAIGELGNADRSKLSILMLPVKPGATWRKKPMAPTWSLNCEKDASQGLDAMAEENHWQLASEAEAQYNERGRAEQLDDLAKKTGTPLTVLNLSVRTMACLQRTSIRDVEELAAMSEEEIMRIRDMGRKGLEELTAELNRWRGAPEESQEVKTLQDLGLSDNCIRVLYDMGFADDDVDILDSFLPEEKERLQRDFPDNWNRIQEYLQSGATDTDDGNSEGSSEDENPTPADDLPWSVAATAAADEPAESPEPADLTPTTETVAAVSEQADNAATVVPASDGTPATFDYSGLDEQTVGDLHLAEREYIAGKKLTEMGLRRMADGVAIAHDALTVTDATICRNGGTGQFAAPEKTFGKWCESIGLNRKAAERLLQVSRLFDASSPKEEKVLEELSPSLLYAAAKPSAPAELVQAVKDGDITTHKQYKALEKQLAEERELRRQAEVGRDAAVKDVRQLEKEQAEDRQWMDSEIEKANQKADIAAKKSAEAWEQVVAEKKARKQAEKERETSERLADDEIARVQRIADDANDRANTAEAKVKELESRPIEVTGADAADIARWRAEGAEQARQETAAQMAAMQEQLRSVASAKENEANTMYTMAQQIAANCIDLLESWRQSADGLEDDVYMDCVEQFLPLRAAVLSLLAEEDTEDEEMS